MNLPWGGGGGEGGQKSYVHQHKKQDIFSAFGEFKAFTLLISCACEAFRYSNKGNSWDTFTQLSIQQKSFAVVVVVVVNISSRGSNSSSSRVEM